MAEIISQIILKYVLQVCCRSLIKTHQRDARVNTLFFIWLKILYCQKFIGTVVPIKNRHTWSINQKLRWKWVQTWFTLYKLLNNFIACFYTTNRSLLFISTSFLVLCAPESWSKYFLSTIIEHIMHC